MEALVASRGEGLAFGLSQFRHSIHEIEALGDTMPYLSKNGWNDFPR